jgi:Co/Zn/Cd efflux system component
MFVVGLGAGLLGESLGLIADSLDMLADALAYGLSLAAIGRPSMFKVRVARMSGTLLLVLGLGVVVDVARRALAGSDPEAGIMLATALLSLVVNATVIRMLTRFRRGEVHLRAAWIFTRADIVANLGVILSAILVFLTGSRYPDLVVGLAIGGYVIREAVEILQRAGQAAEESSHVGMREP